MNVKIKKNDIVKVLYGKDAGKQAKVVKVFYKENKVVVEGVNMFKKHFKGDGKTRQSEIVNIVKPMDLAKVMVICPACNKPTRIGVDRTEKGGKTRVCKKCKKSLDSVVKKEAKDSDKKVVKKVKKTNKK